MDLVFDMGSASEPKGHGIIYFRGRYEQDKLLATYVVTLPLTVDFAKYVPPFLASHLSASAMKDLSAFSLPPVPEEVESHQHLEHLAEMRSDDLVYAGTISSNDLPEVMQAAADAVQEYSRLWSEYVGAPSATSTQESSDAGLGVNEVLYSLMNEQDRLQELSKLVGTLRFAIERDDQALNAEAHEQIALVGRTLPQHYQIEGLLRAAEDASPRGATLAQLYLDRCYRFMAGDDDRAQELEKGIRELEGSS